MTSDQEQTARDDWQSALYEATYRCAQALKQLDETNPWPEIPVLSNAINTLATELWDRCFSVTEITAAFKNAAADLPRYSAGFEVRP
jgi:hypothetical protein